MNEIQLFNNPEFGNVRVIMQDGEPLFCGADVANALGYSNTRDAILRHCKGVVKHDTLTNGGIQEMLFISEPDVYRLVFGSKLPAAERFMDWIAEVVLPSLRKNGGYINGQEQMSEQELLANALKVADRVLAERDKQIATMKPKADYFDALVECNLLTNFRDTAKELRVKESDLIAFLLKKKLVYRDGYKRIKPYAGMMSYFELRETKDNKCRAWVQTMVTPKGREAIRLMMNTEKP